MAKVISKIRTWKITLVDYTDGTASLTRENDGFDAYELLGLLSHTKEDVIKQIEGKIKPTTVKRKLTVE